MTKLPVPEVRELPDDEAWRALYDAFDVLHEEPTQPMPLQLQPLPQDEFMARCQRVLSAKRA